MSENDEANVYLFGAGVHGREISKSLSLLGIDIKEYLIMRILTEAKMEIFRFFHLKFYITI